MTCQADRSPQFIKIFILILLALTLTKQGFAQGGNGTVSGIITGGKGAISGIVSDDSGAILKGAEVTLATPVFNTVSDEQGRFYINNVNPGSYTLTVSYVGFTKFEQPVSVAGGQVLNLEAKLKVQSTNESILVTAERVTGEAEAVNIERSADNLVQVLPAEVIQSLPNANLADALGRLPSVTLERDEGEGKYVQVRGLEPRLTNAMIDGVDVPSPESGVRQVKFDAIPADMVESVQVSKTLQPNMEGDGIGGSVNLITKVATNQPTISIEGLGGYTPIVNGRGATTDGGTVGYRFGQEKKFGILVGGSYDWNGRGIDDIEPVPDLATLPGGQQVGWKDGMDIRQYRYFRTRWGLAGSTDYKISEGSNIYLRAFYSDFHNYGDRYKYSLIDNTPGIQLLAPGNVMCATNSSGVNEAPCTGFPSANGELRTPDIGVSNIVLGGVHDLSRAWFAWDVAVSRGWEGGSSSSDVNFSANPATFPSTGCQYNQAGTANQYLPQWSGECFKETSNPSNFEVSDITRDLGISAQLNIEASGSGAMRYHIGSKLATVEIGGRFRNAHKFNDGYRDTITPDTTALQNTTQFANGYIPMNTFPNAIVNHSYYNGGTYNLGYQPSFEDAFAFYKANPNLFDFSTTQGTDGQEYDLIEKVTAGYIMNTIDLSSRLRLIAGVRVEATSENGTNFLFNNVTNTVGPNKFSGSYITVLPSAALKYAVTPNDNLRFFYARGLSRPDPMEIAEAINITTSGNGTFPFAITLDNPSLKAETGDDLDVLYDHYFGTFGVFSAGYFYKFLHNPIVSTQTDRLNYTPPGGLPGDYQVTQPINAGSAWVSGIELAYLQHFSTLPGAWAGLGLSANYGYTASRANGLLDRSDHPSLARTSPNSFNISPTYDRGRFSFRMGISYNQASIYAYQFTDGLAGGVKGPLSDIWFYTHVQVDAQASVRLNHGLTLLVQGLDLNNEVFGFYQGSPQYMIQREYYQPTYTAGLRWEPTREK